MPQAFHHSPDTRVRLADGYRREAREPFRHSNPIITQANEVRDFRAQVARGIIISAEECKKVIDETLRDAPNGHSEWHGLLLEEGLILVRVAYEREVLPLEELQTYARTAQTLWHTNSHLRGAVRRFFQDVHRDWELENRSRPGQNPISPPLWNFSEQAP